MKRGRTPWGSARRLAASLLVVVAVLSATAASAFAQGEQEGDAIVVVNGPVSVERGESVEGVFVVHGDVSIAGTVTGDVFVISGDTVIEGVVEGDVVAITGPTEVAAGAEIEGDLRWGDEEPAVSPQATIGGEVSDEGWGETLNVLPLVSAIALWIGVSVSALILGIFLVMAAPRAADAVFAQARERLPLCVGFGLAVIVGLPLAIVLASVTLIGLPLGIALLLALLPLAAIAYVASAWALGRALVRDRSRVVAFLAGLAILRALAILPVLGALVGLAAVIVGLGLLVGALGASRAERGAAPAPA
jgi:hypothetical protein